MDALASDPPEPAREMLSTQIAVVIPCFNEEASIAEVVSAFRLVLPSALIVVADNMSTDETAPAAEAAGAVVIHETRKGKGYAMRRLFADVDAQCYVMVDGDNTYDANAAPALVSCVMNDGFDMVVGIRTPAAGQLIYRPGHKLGNRMLSWLFRTLFRLDMTDTLSGFRAMSRRFVKSFPTGASGFEIEADLNAHAALLGVPVSELPTTYTERSFDSESKLNTYRDGLRILKRNLRLFRDARPALAFLILAIPWFTAGILLVIRPTLEYISTGLVLRFPSLIAGTAMLLIGCLSVLGGLIMQRTARSRVEMCRLAYLSHRPFSSIPLSTDVPSRSVSDD